MILATTRRIRTRHNIMMMLLVASLLVEVVVHSFSTTSSKRMILHHPASPFSFQTTSSRCSVALHLLKGTKTTSTSRPEPEPPFPKSPVTAVLDKVWKREEEKGITTTTTQADNKNINNLEVPSVFFPSSFFNRKNRPSVRQDDTIQPEELTTTTGTSTTTSDPSMSSSLNPQQAIPVILAGLLAAAITIANSLGVQPTDVMEFGKHFTSNPQETLQDVIEFVQELGPSGPLYFGIIYLVAEILAVPATPLTLSAGYLFGLTQGTLVVLLAATLAASVSFVVGKTVLRGWVEDILEEKPEFRKLDKAVGQQGFQLLLLVRLSPIFPFALSNYLYGASSIDFASYFWGTLLGFTPGTMAYVYTGMVGQALTLDGGANAQPWYVYAGGFTLLLTFLKIVTDVATDLINTLEEDDDDDVI